METAKILLPADPKEEEAAIASLSESTKEMDPSSLATFLGQLLNEAWFHPELQILKLIDYYGTELSQVSSFQWVNLFQNYPLSNLIHVPFSLIPTPVYQKSLAFFNTLPLNTLCDVVLWASDLILSEWPGVVKVEQLNSDISKVATFVVLAMVLRAQPVALTLVLSELRESPTCQGQDKLPFLIWMMSQASQGDLPAGLYLWARNLLPLVVNNEECYSSHSIDLILQSVEMIFSSNPEARAILVNGAVRHGERLIPPCSFEMLVRLTFPPARVEGEEATTKRFKAIYPLLKEVALAPDTNTSADALEHIFSFSLELAGGGQGNPALANEATAIAISVLTQNVDCFKQWGVLYKENLEASVALLKKLADPRDDHTHILALDALTVKHAMNSFRKKNKKAITEGVANLSLLSLYKEADYACRCVSIRLSHMAWRTLPRIFSRIETRIAGRPFTSRGPEIAPFTFPADPKEEAAIASLSEAAKRIDASHSAVFVDEEVGVPELDLLGFNYYLLEAFSQVSSLPWFNMLKKSPLSDVPLSHIPKSVYETAADWIIKLPFRTQWKFVVWAYDRLLIDWAAHARGEEQTYAEHQVATLVELAMVLRAKSDSLTCLLPMLRWKPKYHGQDKLPLLVWMMTQAFQHDLPAGLYSWACNLLPLIVNNEECYSSHSLDLILQFVEMILYSNPEARDVLLNEPVRHGERLIPPRSFEMLVRLTFPPARVEEEEATTVRFKAIYPLLKEVALAPDTNTGADALKQIFTFSLELAGGGQGNPALANEATAIAISVLTQNVDCFKQWDVLYKENLEASVALLKKLADQGEDHTLKLLSSSPSAALTVKHVMNSFRMKNEKAITERVVANLSLYEEADHSCKLYLLRCKLF